MAESMQALRRRIFRHDWLLDDDITAIASTLSSHSFLANPAGQYSYIYLTQYVRAMTERLTGEPFSEARVLDWGCGKGHVTKLLRELNPSVLDSCDLLCEKDDSSFGQETPIIQRYGIEVRPLQHEFVLPYEDASFDALLSVGVLEHVSNDQASLHEIERVLKPGGALFCFFLPTRLSWTQALAHGRGNNYHDRLYTAPQVKGMLATAGLTPVDMWYRQLLPKNTIHYPNFRLFERIDQWMTEYTPLRYFATNIEFVAVKQPQYGARTEGVL